MSIDMPRILTKYINNNRVLRSVKSDGKNNSFLDADVDTQAGFNTGSTPRWVKYDFGVVQTRIVVHLNWGDNGYLMKQYDNVSSVTLDIMPGVNGNGGVVGDTLATFDISLFLSEPENVSYVIFTSNGGRNRPVWNKLNVSQRFVNLKSLDIIANNLNDYGTFINIPIEYIKFTSGLACYYNTSFVASFPTLKYCILTQILSSNELKIFPPNLRYLDVIFSNIGTFDIKDFFSSTVRMGLRFQNITSNQNTIIYSGGAIFPTNIIEESGMPIDYILEIRNGERFINKPTPDMVSQFLIDFANQVKTVTLANKRIRFENVPANTSYTDNSQPLFKTYATALNHITSTLGITVTFT